MDKDQLKRECIAIVDQLFELAKVPMKKRQEINDVADAYLQKRILKLFFHYDSPADKQEYKSTRKYVWVCPVCEIESDDLFINTCPQCGNITKIKEYNI